MQSTDILVNIGGAALGSDPQEPLASRIRARLAALGRHGEPLHEREASRRAGLSLSYVGDILSGRSKQPNVGKLMRLADALECDVDYLLGLQDAPRAIPGRSAARAADESPVERRIPLLGSPEMTADAWFRLGDSPVEQVPAILGLEHVASAYAVAVPNDRNAPRYFTGEIVYVNPARPVRAGDFVLATRKSGSLEGRAGIARLLGISAAGIELEMLDGERATVLPEEITVHRIVGSAG